MKKEIKCSKCASQSIKVTDEDYLHSEELDKKQSKYFTRHYLCWDCEYQWKEEIDRGKELSK